MKFSALFAVFPSDPHALSRASERIESAEPPAWVLTDAQIEVTNAVGYDWGNLVVQGLLALLTLVTLIWTIRVGTRDRRERVSNEEKQQASQVAAWEQQTVVLKNGSPVSRDPDEFRTQADASGARERRLLYVHNGSQAPIFDVVVKYWDASALRDATEGTEEDLTSYWQHRILPPAAEPRTIEVPQTIYCGSMSDDTVLEIEFRDGLSRPGFSGGSELTRRR